jgi:ABC-type Fe3+ transport system substrate-binding protein
MQRAPQNDLVMTSLAAARRLVRDLQPYSPAWDAAMAWVDDLEREAGYKWATIGTAEPVALNAAF